MSKLRIAVVGTGHLGRIHAKLLQQVDGVELIGLSDPLESARQRAAELFGVDAYADYRQLIEQSDAVVIATPTDTHTEVAETFLKAGKHVFVEKPLTISGRDADRLVMIAAKNRLTLQVGHVERFNPAFVAIEEIGTEVKYVEAVRASSFPGRCLDVGVVLDLMIHDLDLVLSMTQAAVSSIHSSGLSVVSDHEDIAEARLEFECGLVANLKASRISPTPARSMQVFGAHGFAEIDFGQPAISVVQPCKEICDRSFDLSMEAENPLTYASTLFSQRMKCETIELQPRNAILDELHDFAISIQTGVPPTVDGVAGARAVNIAEQILATLEEKCWYEDAERNEIGPHAIARESILQRSRRVHGDRKAA